MKRIFIALIVVVTFTVFACGGMRAKGDPGGFQGTYYVGETEAIVFPIYEAYEVEMQIFGDPFEVYFKGEDEEGNVIYLSDDDNFKFVMRPDMKTGTFYEINEPPLKIVKE